ncbi:MAG: ABC transporter permease [Deltaproteobacteria bacterium]|nr:ABC transporter permease [Deltaproteobacteria bacterium]
MGRFLAITWRDLWRNPRRTLLTGLVMTFSVAVMIFFVGLGDGAHTKMIRSMTDSFLGHAQIQAEGWLDDPDLERRIDPARLDAILERLPGAPGVAGVAPRVVTGGLLSRKIPDPVDPDDLEAWRELTSEGAFVVGVDPDRERTVTTLAVAVVADDPADRCLRGCRAALAELAAPEEGRCTGLCADAGSSFEGDACAAAGERLCAGRCPPEDDLCDPSDCTGRFADYCTPARFLLDRDPAPEDLHRGEAVLGAGLAKVLGVGVGDRVALQTGAARGRSHGAIWRIAGLVRTGSTDINRTFAVTHREKLAAGLGIPGSATAVALALDDLDGADRLAAGVQARLEGLGGLDTLSWRRLSPELDLFVKIDQGGTLVMLTLLVMIVGVILANVVTMSVLERTREYGVRMAVGEPPARLSLGLLGEVLLLALLSSVLGSVLGGGLNLWFETRGIDFGMGEFETTGVVMDTVYPTEVTLYGFVFAVGTVLFFSLAGALYPAWRIRRLRPVDALRFV